MRIISFCTSWWTSREDFERKLKGPFGLDACRKRGLQFFKPFHTFIACGTWSEPFCEGVINAGVDLDRPYEPVWWNYSSCALTAACAFLANQRDWDLTIYLDTDTLLGNVDWDTLLREFLSRPEEVMGDDWYGRPGYIVAWKPASVVRFLHQRLRANLIERTDETPEPMLCEDEFGLIFKGRYWNPWPHLKTSRQDFGLESAKYVEQDQPLREHWPFLRLPDPAIVDTYLKTETALAKPVRDG